MTEATFAAIPPWEEVPYPSLCFTWMQHQAIADGTPPLPPDEVQNRWIAPAKQCGTGGAW